MAGAPKQHKRAMPPAVVCVIAKPISRPSSNHTATTSASNSSEARLFLAICSYTEALPRAQ